MWFRRAAYLVLLLVLGGCADLSHLEGDIEDIKEDISQIREECDRINAQIEALETLVAQVNAREYITGVSQILGEDGEVVGYMITFQNSQTMTFFLPETDDAGLSLISVVEEDDGIWWVCGDDYIYDADGERVPVGQGGTTPMLKVEGGVWQVSVDGGETWQVILASDDSEQVFTGVVSVTEEDDSVTFVLGDGTSFVLPKFMSANMTISYRQDVAAGVDLDVRYSYTTSTGVAEVSVFGNDYIGSISHRHNRESSSGVITVSLSEDHDVALQKLFVYLNYGDGVIAKEVAFNEKGTFRIEPIPAMPASGGDFDLVRTVDGYDYVYSEVVQGGGWLSGMGDSYTVQPNTDQHARVGAIRFEARTQYFSTIFTKMVYVVQLGTGSIPCYEEYVGLWKGNLSGTVLDVRFDHSVDNGYLIYGLSAAEVSSKASYDAVSGQMVSSASDFLLSADKNTMYSANESFQRQGMPTYYVDGEVVMLNRAASEFTPLNLVILGDGYQIKDLRQGGKFEKNARSAMGSFFAMEPYKSFKDRFDVYMVPFTSVDEGTDITSSGTYKDTYYSSVCAGGGNTLATCDYDKVQQTVRNLGLTEANYGFYRTAVIVLVNTTEQSGSCWYIKGGKIDSRYVGDGIKSFAIATLAAETMGASGLVRHEAGGHAFGRLADEYNWGATADESKKQDLRNQQNNLGYYQNVSADMGADSPWAHFIGLPGYENVGYYEGAWGCSAGIYRPTENSIMLNNQGGFNAPSREIIYKRIILQSEGAGRYSFDEFLEYDKRNL